jgi:hypothetical protein
MSWIENLNGNSLDTMRNTELMFFFLTNRDSKELFHFIAVLYTNYHTVIVNRCVI